MNRLDDLFCTAMKYLFIKKQLGQLTTEIYKSLTDLSPEFKKPFFTVKKNYHITYEMGIS